MIHVIATIHLQPGARDAFVAEFERIVAQVRAEPGCIDYLPTIDADTGIASQQPVGPDAVVVVERWASLDALKAHDAAPHMGAFRARVRDLVRGREIRMLVSATVAIQPAATVDASTDRRDVAGA